MGRTDVNKKKESLKNAFKNMKKKELQSTVDKPVSRYFEKQWKNFNIEIEKSDMKEAFVEHEPSPEPEEETMYTRRKARKFL